ncbi:MAG: hypothetical protein HYV94_15620 [Candidatus Rokubacteria bacterium]|nr:hypothetical protein [Candidatus Rokubacteria bacterium]
MTSLLLEQSALVARRAHAILSQPHHLDEAVADEQTRTVQARRRVHSRLAPKRVCLLHTDEETAQTIEEGDPE